MNRIKIDTKRQIFLIEYLLFLPIAIIGGLLADGNLYMIRFGLVYIALFSISYFVVKFCVYRYCKSFDLRPLASMILAFIITFHFVAPVPIVS